MSNPTINPESVFVVNLSQAHGIKYLRQWSCQWSVVKIWTRMIFHLSWFSWDDNIENILRSPELTKYEHEGIFCRLDILTSLFWWLFWHLQIITNIDISDSAGFCTQHYSSYSPLLVTSDTRMIWYCVHCLQRLWKITL